eukprot:14954870-Ditylum_brightwellii.AAC.1
MEADAAFVLTQRLYHEKNVLVQKIVADDNSSMKAILRHSYQQKLENCHLFPNFVWPRNPS